MHADKLFTLRVLSCFIMSIGANVVRIDFTSSVHSEMPWKFKPTQSSVRIVPGETALAFYTVSNPTDKAIMGVATYNVHPPKAGLYFNKIQCFCFEEQRLGAKEEIDMPGSLVPLIMSNVCIFFISLIFLLAFSLGISVFLY